MNHPALAFDTVELDGHPHTVPAGTTLADLLALRGVAPDAVATAVNQRFVPRSARGDTVLTAGDRITTFEAITGG